VLPASRVPAFAAQLGLMAFLLAVLAAVPAMFPALFHHTLARRMRALLTVCHSGPPDESLLPAELALALVTTAASRECSTTPSGTRRGAPARSESRRLFTPVPGARPRRLRVGRARAHGARAEMGRPPALPRRSPPGRESGPEASTDGRRLLRAVQPPRFFRALMLTPTG
jgi:hypothetical protein